MLAYKFFGAGMQGLAVDALLRDVSDTLTATGTGQSTAYACTFAVNAFSTVAAGTGAILDPNASKGDTQLIYNGGANALKVYPVSGASINGLAANVAVTLPVRTACQFHCISATLWTGILSA